MIVAFETAKGFSHICADRERKHAHEEIGDEVFRAAATSASLEDRSGLGRNLDRELTNPQPEMDFRFTPEGGHWLRRLPGQVLDPKRSSKPLVKIILADPVHGCRVTLLIFTGEKIMQLSATGWRRFVHYRTLAMLDITKMKKSERVPWDGVSYNLDRHGIELHVRISIPTRSSMSGNYNCQLTLPDREIARLFVLAFRQKPLSEVLSALASAMK